MTANTTSWPDDPKTMAGGRDKLVGLRNRIIDSLVGVPAGQVLNAGAGAETAGDATDLAAGLKQAVNQLKMAAVDPDGYRVDYGKLRHSQVYLELRTSYTPQLRSLDPGGLETQAERLAFWINLYNALTIDAVIAHGVERSVTEGRLGLLRFFRQAAYDVGGLRASLEDIEHGILRANRGHPYLPGPQFGPADPRLAWVVSPPDPRIHFALNCASRSCPPIAVYDPDGVDAQLDLAARGFVANEVAVDPARTLVRLSSIFRWYEADFGGRSGVIRFLSETLPDEGKRQWLLRHSGQVKLTYTAYDWSLNS